MAEKNSDYIILEDKKHFHRKDEKYGSPKKSVKVITKPLEATATKPVTTIKTK